MKKEKILYIVVPCYNEEEVLNETTKRLTDKLNKMIKDKIISKESKIIYVNDGSKDKTWQLIENLNKENKFVEGVKLSRNRGHQNALLAGLMTAKKYADIIVSMDADLHARSANTRPIAAGEAARNPKALPSGASNAVFRAEKAPDEKANSKCPASLIYNSPAYLSVRSNAI